MTSAARDRSALNLPNKTEHRGRERRWLGVLLALATGVFLVAPWPASASHSFIIPASDNGCEVDLKVEATHGSGHARIGYGDITFTNLETGATYLQRSRYSLTETYDPSTDSWDVEINGNIWHSLFSGEPGPSGVVQEPGLELLVSGKLELTFDSNDAVTAFSLNGTYDDLCALLSD